MLLIQEGIYNTTSNKGGTNWDRKLRLHMINVKRGEVEVARRKFIEGPCAGLLSAELIIVRGR